MYLNKKTLSAVFKLSASTAVELGSFVFPTARLLLLKSQARRRVKPDNVVN